MNWTESVVLGVVQGLTEFLPISSTAHMNVVPALLGWPRPGDAAEAIIQLGTVAAVVLYFWRDLVRVGGGWLRSLLPSGGRERPQTLEARQGWAIVAGTIPVCVAGVLLEKQIGGVFRTLPVIGTTQIVMALLLAAAEAWSRRRRRTLAEATVRDGWLVGLAQALALVPGASRSGSTLTAAFLLGFEREAGARFSFLLSVPAIVLAGLYKTKDFFAPDPPIPGTTPTMVWTLPGLALATLVAGVVGYLSIAFLLGYLRKHSTLAFVIYRVALGALILYLAGAGFLDS